MTQEELNAALAASPSPDRVTPEYLKSRIHSVGYIGPNDIPSDHPDRPTMTICVITLDNGFTVTGESACADPANYKEAIGRKIAYDMAERQIWPLLGFALKEAMTARDAPVSPPTLQEGFAAYVSHKRVEAAEMVSGVYNEDGSGKVTIRGGEVVDVPAGFVRFDRAPLVGDILVRYPPDNYVSWSPRDKFLAGYRDAEGGR